MSEADGESDELQEILSEFLRESREVIAEVEPSILILERGDGDVTEAIRVVFRLFHSMKGGASSLDFTSLQRLTHEAESLLAELRDQKLAPNAGEVDALCEALDCARALLDTIERSGSDNGHHEAVDRISLRLAGCVESRQQRRGGGEASPVETPAEEQPSVDQEALVKIARESFSAEANELLDVIESLALDSEKGPISEERIGEALRAVHTFKGNCGFAGLAEPEALAHKLEDLLVEARKSPARFPGNAPVVLKVCDALRSATRDSGDEAPIVADVEGLKKELEAACKRLEGGAGKSKKLGEILVERGVLTAGQLEELLRWQNKKVGELAVDLGLTSSEAIEQALSSQEAAPLAAPVAPPPEKTKDTSSQYIRVGLAKLDSLLDQVGELITTAAAVSQNERVQNDEGEQLRQAVAQLARITSGLHDTAMEMRMVPLSGTLRRMFRVARDVSQRLGKRVELALVGEGTEVDKTVAEALGDPLVHMVRNAIDHGVELPSVRAAKGKPEVGSVVIEAKHQGGEVWVEIRDDGAGIDSNRLLEKARGLGLVAPDVTPPMPELLELIFHPGLSTAEKITDVSGRGVGMDVVRSNLESIRGRVSVASELDKGTTVAIRIPLTLAIIDAMLVRVFDRLYALPLLAIRESISSEDASVIILPQQGEMLRVREELVPVLRISDLHRIPPQEEASSRVLFVVLESAGEQVALPVNEILGQRQTVVKPLDGYVGNIRCAVGCSILGSGEVCLILDAGALLKEAGGQRGLQYGDTSVAEAS